MDLAIGIGRAIMVHEQGRTSSLPRLTHGLVEIGLGPAGKDLRFLLRQTSAHGEGRVGQEHRIAIVTWGSGCGSIVHDENSR